MAIPPNMIMQPGQTASRPPSFPSFLPTDNSMATGLTPQMQQQIGGMPQPGPVTPQPGTGGGAAGPGSNYQQLLDFFQQMGGFGGSFGGGMGGGGGQFAGGPMGGLVPQNPSRQQVKDAARFLFTGMPMPANVPKPPQGANGMVSPGDLSAYTSAQKQADQQRDTLAKQMMANRRKRTPGGSR